MATTRVKDITNVQIVALAIEQAATDFQGELEKAEGGLMGALRYSGARRTIINALDDNPDMFDELMSLRNTYAGWLTDRDPDHVKKDMQKMYSTALIKSCMADAALLGLRFRGREMMILQGKLYITAEGAEALFIRTPGIHNVDCHADLVSPGVRSRIAVQLSWSMAGQDGSQSFKLTSKKDGNVIDYRVYTVKGMNDSSLDDVLPKGRRRAFIDALRMIKGEWIVPLDSQDEIRQIPQDRGDQLNEHLKERAAQVEGEVAEDA